jgi:hypothetical protein
LPKSNGKLSKEQKEIYRKRVELRLDEFDTRIDELRAKADAVNTGEAKETVIEKRIDELEKRKEAVHSQLDNIETVDLEGWENYQTKMNTAMDNLDRSYDQLRSRLTQQAQQDNQGNY